MRVKERERGKKTIAHYSYLVPEKKKVGHLIEMHRHQSALAYIEFPIVEPIIIIIIILIINGTI